jgi:NAD(P)-dependent dehydrogenase (short-subunit alcohol dehydrogenase family)
MSINEFSLNEKIVLLTGGAGLYGSGLTRFLARHGARLIIASRDTDALEKLASEEREKGYEVEVEYLDLADPESIEALTERVLAKEGRIDGLVNNAVSRPMQKLDDPAEAWVESMKINATGLFLLSRVVGEAMQRQKRGSIVNIGSIQGMIGPNNFLYEGTDMTSPPDYYFHKGGMISLTRYLASTYGPDGVRVNCLSPGGFFNNQAPEFLERYNKMTMLGRMADDNDLGGAVVFLLSDASSYITGVNLPVDGGYTAK